MVNWITLEQAAEKVGVRKGTLCMWRNRKKFPFKTSGKGRSLLVNETSVDDWIEANKDNMPKGRSKARKPLGKKGPGRPPKKAKSKATARPSSRGACEIVVKGDLDLGAIQGFVADIKAGCKLQVAKDKGGYILTTIK